MGKQRELAGMERPKIQELEDKGEVYERAVRAHKRSTDKLKADKQALLDAMQKHGVSSYRTDDGKIFSVADGTPKISISDAPDASDDDDTDAEDAKKN